MVDRPPSPMLDDWKDCIPDTAMDSIATIVPWTTLLSFTTGWHRLGSVRQRGHL